MPNEKKSACRGDPVGHEARARQLDHRPDRRPRPVAALLVDDAVHQPAHDLQLLLVGHERNHHLELRRVAVRLAAPPGAARTIACICIS